MFFKTLTLNTIFAAALTLGFVAPAMSHDMSLVVVESVKQLPKNTFWTTAKQYAPAVIGGALVVGALYYFCSGNAEATSKEEAVA